ncbi:MAG: hypothetical protein HZB83_01300 [Deltaproteobacteria bacterium]|nr:hypothetical protein [Deltaproteobacteria bacterium]
MSYNAITTTEIQTGKPSKQSLWQKVKDNFEYFFSSTSGASGIRNGSFEIDSDSDGIPDNWTRYLYPGGSAGFETTNPLHGAKGYYFTHPGGASNGGGYLESDYAEVSELETLFLRWILKSSVIGIKNIVTIRYYDKAKVYLSSIDLYNAVANVTSAKKYYAEFTPPASARYIRVRLIGGYTDTNVAGTVWFDDVEFGEASTTDSGTQACMGTVVLGLLNVQTTPYYLTTLGRAAANGTTNNESYCQFIPHSPITIRDLFVHVSVAPAAGESIVVTLRKNGVDTGLAVTIANPGTSGSNTANTVDFGPADKISISCDGSSGIATTIDVKASFRCLQYGSTNGESMIPFNQYNDGTAANYFYGVCPTNSNVSQLSNIPLARGTFFSRIANSPYAASRLINGALLYIDTGGQPLSSGDRFGAQSNPGVAGYIFGSFGLGRYRWNDETVGIIPFGVYNQAQNTTLYMAGLGETGKATESEVTVPIKAGKIKNLALYNTSTGVAGQTWTATVRKNGVDTALTVTLNGTTVFGMDVTNAIAFVDGDLLSIKLVSSATTGTRTLIASVEHVDG